MSTEHDDRSPASRRQFMAMTGAAVVTGSIVPTAQASHAPAPEAPANEVEPMQDGQQDEASSDDGITVDSIEQAEKLAGVKFTPAEREQMLQTVRRNARGYETRQQSLPTNDVAPATVFDPRLPGRAVRELSPRFERSTSAVPSLPQSDVDIAFAPVHHLSRWVESGKLSSERLTRIYLDRLKKHNESLECVITLTESRAMSAAKRADREIAAGRYRGPLHGIPWGAKDLLETKDIATTWGAAPYKQQVGKTDAAVVRMLDDAGAVLVAKLTLGALAYGDIWYGGRTNNPWNNRQGSSGSSAGSAAATVAGLVGFSLGTETLGSIVSPSMRCGATGLRPTFGRVPRTGAMALCWSLDKIGPICRSVEDCALVLNAINGVDVGDASGIDMPFQFDVNASPRRTRIGYSPSWFEGRRANDLDRNALESMRGLGVELVEIELPELPLGQIRNILNVEAATALEELTLSDRDDELVWQSPNAWPNTFRATRFVSAIEFLQAQRARRQVMEAMADVFEPVDAIFGPSFAGGLLTTTNFTGHPSLTLRCGFHENGSPHGVTIWGNLFDDGRICQLGVALEKALGVWDARPDLS